VGEVGDEPTEVAGVAHAVLVLDADRDLVAVLVEGRGKDVEALAEHVELRRHGGQLLEPQGGAEDLHARRAHEPGSEVRRLPAEHLLRAQPLDRGDARRAGADVGHAVSIALDTEWREMAQRTAFPG